MTRPDQMTGGGLRAATPRRRPRLSVGEQYPARWRRPRYSSAPPAREAHRIPRPVLVARRVRPLATRRFGWSPCALGTLPSRLSLFPASVAERWTVVPRVGARGSEAELGARNSLAQVAAVGTRRRRASGCGPSPSRRHRVDRRP